MKDNKFSAFKLFYDEFIYKDNKSVSYDKVRRNIDNIRDYTLNLRKTSKHDTNYYMTVLERTQKRIKEQLENILLNNKSFLEFYLIIYKNHVELSNDKVKDVPFIISTSFYDDYRIDNKSSEELESSTYAVPRFTSLEKKVIRKESKNFAKIEYFVNLLKNSNYINLYKQFIDKITYVLKLRPVVNEGHYDFFQRIDVHLIECERLWNRLEEKAKTNEDYDNISEVMEVAYKKEFKNWGSLIKMMINEYFDDIYNTMQFDDEVRGRFSLVNDMSFESFRDTLDKLIVEKEQLITEYENGKFTSYIYEGNSYLLQFKKVLIDSFFDSRFNSKLKIDDSVEDYVARAIELYSLADDLDDRMFEKIMFDASHSPVLKRGNDATTALIVKMYELYNPLYLLSIYDNAKRDFEDLLEHKNIDFKREYNVKLLDKKMEYDFHGPLPNINSIRTKTIERRIEFIYESCITELFSREFLNIYDTRNYDLDVIARDISIEDMVNLYFRMKNKIEDFDFSNMNFAPSTLVEPNYEKNKTLKAAQEFVVKRIFAKLKIKTTKEREIIDKYIDICNTYLKEDIIFIDNVIKISDDTLEEFNNIKNEYVSNSKWNRFLKNNKLKNSI